MKNKTLRSLLKSFGKAKHIEENILLQSMTMVSSMKSENKVKEATNFKAWKTMTELILAKAELLVIVKGKVTKPVDDEGKTKYEKDDITTRSIIVDSIRDHLIPYVANRESSK